MHDPVDPHVHKALADAAPRRFAAGFSDRVMARVAEEQTDLLVVSPRQFLRLAAGVAAASLLLAGYSILVAEPYEDQSLLEAALGLEPPGTTSLYELDPILLLMETDE